MAKTKKNRQGTVHAYGNGNVGVPSDNPSPTPISEWKRSSSSTDTTSLALPSGNVCIVRQIGPEDFLTNGTIPDSLIGIVSSHINDASGKPPVSEKEIVEELIGAGSISSMIKMTDGIVVLAMQSPVVLPVPAPGAERDDSCLYVDEIDLQDKAFIMQYVLGGTRDLERFRKQQEAAMAGLGPQQQIEL